MIPFFPCQSKDRFGFYALRAFYLPLSWFGDDVHCLATNMGWSGKSGLGGGAGGRWFMGWSIVEAAGQTNATNVEIDCASLLR